MTQKILRRLHLDWPLLGKELLEQSARKQMYVIRVVYAVVLFGAFCFYYARYLAEGSVLAMGRGRAPFSFLVTAQLVTIFLFLPPLMAGAVAQEKERDTLGLLFLTDLTPWEFILQKYFGRLIPMLTLLFLSLPLLAVTYSLGGVSADMLYSSAATLFLTCLLVGALALECSVHEGTTFQALVRCWGLCLVFVMCCAMGPIRLAASLPVMFGSSPARSGLVPFALVVSALVYLAPTVLFLAHARNILESRAFVKRRNPFGQQFKQLDQYWKDLRKLLRALKRKRDPEARALAEQVVRRGLNAAGDERSWSPGGYLLARMQIPNVLAFAVIFGVIALIALVTNVALEPKSGGAFFVVVAGIWLLVLMTVPIQSANAVASERMNERLGPMLTTPLTSREILDEWLAPVRRWIQFLMRPLMVIFAVEALVKFYTVEPRDLRGTIILLYLAISLLTVWIYPALMLWTCFWIGLRIRNQIRALLTAFLLVAAWAVLPPIAAGYLVQTGLWPADWREALNFISPAAIIRAAEMLGRDPDSSVIADLLPMTAVHFGIAAALLWWIRRKCLANADRWLGRI